MFSSRDLLATPLQSDELLKMMSEVMDPFFLGGYEIISLDLSQNITLLTGDYFILNTPSKRIMYYFVFEGDDNPVIEGTYNEIVFIRIPAGLALDQYPVYVMNSISYIPYFRIVEEFGILYFISLELGKVKLDHFFSVKFNSRYKVEEVGFSIVSENDTKVVVDALALKIFAQFGIDNQESVMAFFNLTVKPLLGTLNCVENLIKMLDVGASVTEWYETQYLFPYKFIINLPDSDSSVPIQDFIDLILLLKNERSWLAKVGSSNCRTPLPWDTFVFDVALWDDIEGIKYKGVKVCRKHTISHEAESTIEVWGYGIDQIEGSWYYDAQTDTKWCGVFNNDPWSDSTWYDTLDQEGDGLYGYFEQYPLQSIGFKRFVVPDDLVPSVTLTPLSTLTPMGTFRRVLDINIVEVEDTVQIGDIFNGVDLYGGTCTGGGAVVPDRMGNLCKTNVNLLAYEGGRFDSGIWRKQSNDNSFDSVRKTFITTNGIRTYLEKDTDYSGLTQVKGVLFEDGSANLCTISEPTVAQLTTQANVSNSGSFNIFARSLDIPADGVDTYAYMDHGNLSASSGQIRSISFFVEMLDALGIPICIQTFGLTSDFGVVCQGAIADGTVKVEHIQGNIYRIKISATLVAFTPGSFGIVRYAGNRQRHLRVTGYQFENNTYSTSYILTTGGTATRNENSLSIPSTNIIRSNNFAIFLRGTYKVAGDNYWLVTAYANAGADIFCIYHTSTGLMGAAQRTGGSWVIDKSAGITLTAGDSFEIIVVRTDQGLSVIGKKTTAGVWGTWGTWSDSATTTGIEVPTNVMLGNCISLGSAIGSLYIHSFIPMFLPTKASLALYKTDALNKVNSITAAPEFPGVNQDRTYLPGRLYNVITLGAGGAIFPGGIDVVTDVTTLGVSVEVSCKTILNAALILVDYVSNAIIERYEFDNIPADQWYTVKHRFDNLPIGLYGITVINKYDSSSIEGSVLLRNPQFDLTCTIT